MAGGTQSPRQKMINLMYLIFIAMLAMNMSKEVLQAFGLMDNKLVAANDAATTRNSRSYEDLAMKAIEQSEKYSDENAKAKKIQQVSDEYNAYIESLKEEMKGTVDDPTDYETMDSGKFLDEKFFKGNDGVYNEAGQEFVDRMNKYRSDLSAAMGEGNENIKKDVETRFSTDKVTNREGKEIFWLDYNYKQYAFR